MTRYAQSERHALADTLRESGPDHPTLCHPWRTSELAAHLLIRDTRPDLSVGQFVKPLQGRLDQALHEKAAQPYAELVDAVRGGPPWWTPAAWPPVDEAVNLMEYFVHHEDVLRAAPQWQPRQLDPSYEVTMWEALCRSARLLFRRATVGVVLDAGTVGRHEARPAGDQEMVVVSGPVADLILYSHGRRSVAAVKLSGSEDAVASVAATKLAV